MYKCGASFYTQLYLTRIHVNVLSQSILVDIFKGHPSLFSIKNRIVLEPINMKIIHLVSSARVRTHDLMIVSLGL